mgnify:FL=1
MRQQCSDASLLSDGNSTTYCVLQQAKTKSPPLVGKVNRKPCENDKRDRVLTHPLADALRCFKRVDLANGQAEISCNAFSIACHKGSGRTATLSLTCVTMKPFGKDQFSAVEFLQTMM